MEKQKKKRGRKALIILSVFAALALITTVYGYIARQNPERMKENRIVKLERLTYIDLPATRFIGMEVVEDWPAALALHNELWARSGEFLRVLEAMTEYATVITEVCALTHNNNQAHGESESPEHYLIGKFMAADTPVPEGFAYYDVPSTKAALGVFKGEWNDMMENGGWMLWQKIERGKYNVPYPEGWFFVEVYIEGSVPEEGVVSKMGFLNPVVK